MQANRDTPVIGGRGEGGGGGEGCHHSHSNTCVHVYEHCTTRASLIPRPSHPSVASDTCWGEKAWEGGEWLVIIELSWAKQIKQVFCEAARNLNPNLSL